MRRKNEYRHDWPGDFVKTSHLFTRENMRTLAALRDLYGCSQGEVIRRLIAAEAARLTEGKLVEEDRAA